MTVDRHLLNWGVFFVVLGAVPLAVQRGVIASTAVQHVWTLWPLIIVALGLSLILRRTPAFFVGGIVSAAIIGLIFGSVLAVGPAIASNCAAGGDGGSSLARTGSFSGPATVDLHLSCGLANVVASPGSAWTLKAENTNSTAAVVDAGADRLSVRTGDNAGWWLNGGRDTWTVSLPADPQLALTAEVSAGEAHLDLRGAHLTSTRLAVNAGSARLDLSGATVTTVSISVNAGSGSVLLPSGSDYAGDASVSVGSLDLCTPPELGLAIELNQSLGGDNLGAAGMRGMGGGRWQSGNFDSAAHHATLQVKNSLGSVNLNPAGGCK